MVKSVSRSLDLLQILGSENKKFSIAELSSIADLPPSTIHRLLNTLKQYKFVCKDEYSSLYYLGPALVTLGIKAGNYIDIRTSAIPVMRSLANNTGEDSYLAISDGNEGIFLERIAGPNPLKIIDPFNTHVPLHCGALRKVLLANKDIEFIDDYVDNELKSFTNLTVTKPKELISNLNDIRENGHALSVGEYIEDAVGIGAPIKDKFGNVIASIGIIGPVSRLTDDKYDSLIKEVKKHAKQLSQLLGFHSV